MRVTATKILIVCAVAAAIFSFLADDGFTKLGSLSRSLEQQSRTNERLQESVQSLKREVAGLQADAREVERAARSELGMARSDEMVVIFEKKGDASEKSR